MTETTVNVPLLRKAVEWAEAEAAKPDVECVWEQREWSSPPLDRAWYIARRRLGEDARVEALSALARTIETAISCETAYCIAGYVGQSIDARYATASTVDGVQVEDFATEALGLKHGDAATLFHGGNTIADVRRIAEDIAGERL